jgi:predicted transcriptional regulator
MIENIFEFNNMTAADCMIHRTDVTALQVDESHREIMKTITESGLSRFPVYGEDLDDVLGTVTTRDYLLALSEGRKKTLRQILRPAHFVPESVRTDVLFRDMQRNKTHMAIVVDEYGGTSGLVTMEDLLEEIVGNIYDEYDPPLPQDIQKVGEQQYRIAGSASLETINEALKTHLPVDQGFDIRHGRVMVVMFVIVIMVMIVIVVMVMIVMMPVMDVLRLLLSTVYRDLHMRPGDAALHRRLRGDRDTREAQSIHFINKSLPVFRQLQQGRGQHIARGTHRTFQIQRLHSVFLPLLSVNPARSRASTSTGTSRICSTIPRIGLTTARVQTKSRKA